MNLDDWDRLIAPHLQAIEVCASAAARHANELVARPDFETLAEDQLVKAFNTLSAALDKIITARKAYQGKPLETA